MLSPSYPQFHRRRQMFGHSPVRHMRYTSLVIFHSTYPLHTPQLLTGRIPYEDYLHNWRVIQDVMQGVSPVRPDDTVIHNSRALSTLLENCWVREPSLRPDIEMVEKELEVMTLIW